MTTALPNISAEIIWAVTRNSNCFRVSGRTDCKTQFSRDRMNIKKLNARSVAGYARDKAVGIVPSHGGGVTMIKKKNGAANKPSKSTYLIRFGKTKSTRKTYKAVANAVAGSGYRPDLRRVALQAVSAIRKSQRPVRPTPHKKQRGAKAKRAAAAK